MSARLVVLVPVGRELCGRSPELDRKKPHA